MLVTIGHAFDGVELHRRLRADDGEHVLERPRRLGRVENKREVVRQRALAEARLPDRGRASTNAALVDVDDVFFKASSAPPA